MSSMLVHEALPVFPLTDRRRAGNRLAEWIRAWQLVEGVAVRCTRWTAWVGDDYDDDLSAYADLDVGSD